MFWAGRFSAEVPRAFPGSVGFPRGIFAWPFTYDSGLRKVRRRGRDRPFPVPFRTFHPPQRSAY